MPSGLAYMPGQSSVQTVLASGASPRPEGWTSDSVRIADFAREGPFDACASPMDTEDSPLVTMGLPGCLYWITSYSGSTVSDMNPAFGLQLHHPRFLEFIGAPESAWLLYHSPKFWVDRLGEENAMVAAVNLQRDAGIMLSNLQILSQFVTSLHRMSSEMMSIDMGRVVYTAGEMADLSTAPRAPRAAKYMAVMGLWRPQTGPGDPGPVPASSCNASMNCRYCFPEGRLPPALFVFFFFMIICHIVTRTMWRRGMNAVITRHFLPVGDCPGYVTFILDMHYGMPSALLVSFSLWSNVLTFDSYLLFSNVFWYLRTSCIYV